MDHFLKGHALKQATQTVGESNL